MWHIECENFLYVLVLLSCVRRAYLKEFYQCLQKLRLWRDVGWTAKAAFSSSLGSVKTAVKPQLRRGACSPGIHINRDVP